MYPITSPKSVEWQPSLSPPLSKYAGSSLIIRVSYQLQDSEMLFQDPGLQHETGFGSQTAAQTGCRVLTR